MTSRVGSGRERLMLSIGVELNEARHRAKRAETIHRKISALAEETGRELDTARAVVEELTRCAYELGAKP